MSSHTVDPSSRPARPPALCDLPATVAGWVNHRTHESTLLEYWRRGSTHIVGAYEHLAFSELSNGDIRLHERSYDQFGHQLTGTTLSEQPPNRAEWVWTRARERMEEFPGQGAFDERPRLPTTIGEWDLVSELRDGPDPTVVWELPFGAAELIVEQLRIEALYAHTSRYFAVHYRDPDTEPVTIVSDVTRHSAFVIATTTLAALPAPVSSLSADLDALQSVSGIGPTKARACCLLGIRSPEELATHLGEDTPLISSHSEAVETLLTTRIRGDLRARFED